MSGLPTLWVYGPSLAQAMATPADRVARVSAFLLRDHDESREHEFVPAARLDAANLEIATLKALLTEAADRVDSAWCGDCGNTTQPSDQSDDDLPKRIAAALTPKEP